MDVVRRILDSRTFWTVMLVALFASVVAMAQRGLARDPRFLARPVFAGARLPAWADRATMQPVVDRLEALGPISLLESELESRVRNALLDCPVIDRVQRVRRHWPRSYSVKVVYRRPCAVVMRDGERLPVTWDGIRLPLAPFEHASRRLFVIEGLDGPIPEPGERIDSPALQDGLTTLRQLAPYLAALGPLRLQSIDVHEAARSRGGVILRTAHGVPVRWGRPRASIGENAVDEKIAYLLAAQENMAALDGYVIDVRYDEPYVRESPSP